jgi:hypothetical protein
VRAAPPTGEERSIAPAEPQATTISPRFWPADPLLADRAGVDLDARLDVAADLEAAQGVADVDDQAVLDAPVHDRALDLEGLEAVGDADVGAEVAADDELADVAVDGQRVAERAEAAGGLDRADVAVDLQLAAEERAADLQQLEGRAAGVHGDVAGQVAADRDRLDRPGRLDVADQVAADRDVVDLPAGADGADHRVARQTAGDRDLAEPAADVHVEGEHVGPGRERLDGAGHDAEPVDDVARHEAADRVAEVEAGLVADLPGADVVEVALAAGVGLLDDAGVGDAGDLGRGRAGAEHGVDVGQPVGLEAEERVERPQQRVGRRAFAEAEAFVDRVGAQARAVAVGDEVVERAGGVDVDVADAVAVGLDGADRAVAQRVDVVGQEAGGAAAADGDLPDVGGDQRGPDDAAVAGDVDSEDLEERGSERVGLVGDDDAAGELQDVALSPVT